MKRSREVLMLIATSVLVTGVAKAEGDDIIAEMPTTTKVAPVAAPKMEEPKVSAETPAAVEKTGPVSQIPAEKTRKPSSLGNVAGDTGPVWDGRQSLTLTRFIDNDTGVACYSYQNQFQCVQTKK